MNWLPLLWFQSLHRAPNDGTRNHSNVTACWNNLNMSNMCSLHGSLFCVTCSYFFKEMLRLGYQAKQAKSKCPCIKALHSNLRRGCDRNWLFLYRNLILEFILLITLSANDSPLRVASRIHPKYFTLECCLIFMLWYIILRGSRLCM